MKSRATFLLCLALIGPAAADLFPPDDCIVLTVRNSLTLSWPAAGSSQLLELYEDEKLLYRYPLAATSLAVAIRPGRRYRWSVTPKGRPPLQSRFSVANHWGYEADADDGFGASGKKVSIRLERADQGMQMWLQCGADRKRFFFASKGRLFRVSARGGAGRNAQAYPFYDPWSEVQEDGTPAGPGGWGGLIEISTRDAPWRDYLEIDVSPGGGGAGSHSLPAQGEPGRPGRIITKILP